MGDPETNHSSAVTCIDVDDREEYLVSGSADSSIRVWDLKSVKSVKLRFKLDGHSTRVVEVKWSARRILSSDENAMVIIWNADEGGLALDPIQAGPEPSLFVSQNGKYCFAISRDVCADCNTRRGHLIDMEYGSIRKTIDYTKNAKSVYELIEELVTQRLINIDCVRPGVPRRECTVKLYMDSGISTRV